MTSTSPLSVFLLLSCFFPEGVRLFLEESGPVLHTGFFLGSFFSSLVFCVSFCFKIKSSSSTFKRSRQGSFTYRDWDSSGGNPSQGKLLFLGLQDYFLLHLNWIDANTLLGIKLQLAKVLFLLLFKCKISKLVDEVYCGGTQVRVLPHTHTSYFIIQIMLLAPCRSRIISASLAAVCPVSNFLVLYYPLPGFLHFNLSFPFW